jgi:SagB-type dehydrogenase family enzyme
MQVPRRELALLVLLGIATGACRVTPSARAEGDTMAQDRTRVPAKTIPQADAQDLPDPDLTGRTTLEETLTRRRSVREFGPGRLTETQIAQLLWAAQGTTGSNSLRTAPSAGALYPLELYVATADGLFLYESETHRLDPRSDRDLRSRLQDAALGQDAIGAAPAVFVITAVYERTAAKYGAGRTPRYVHIEAGHAAQNLLLQAVALGLGGVPMGAFDDERVRETLALPADQAPLYLIPVGIPEGD